MDLEAIHEWLHSAADFNDLELALDEHDDLAALLGVRVPDGHLAPLGFHGSGSWVALWRKDVTTPWGDAAMVWVDSEGSPWEAFAPTARDGLAMLALYTGTVYDALAAASRAADSQPGSEATYREEWRERTPRELADVVARYPDQIAHRRRLHEEGVALPENAFDIALAALRRHGRFSEWLRAQTAPPAPPEATKKPAAKKTTAKKTATKKTTRKPAAKKAAKRR